LLLAALALSVAPQARADDAETRTIARELAMQGATAFESGDYSTALDRFQRAASLFQAPTITLMEARTLVRLNRFVEALDRYVTTQRMALPPDAPEALTQAVADARREEEELRARTPWLKIVVQGAKETDEVHVTLDGKPVPGVLLNVERPIDPGDHEVQASVAGAPPVRRLISVNEGQHSIAHLRLYAPEDPGSTHAMSVSAATTQASESSANESRKSWGYAVGGFGIGALGVSAITGVIALNKQSSLDEICHPGCPESAADDISSFHLNRTLSYVTLGIGLAGVGTGAYLLLSGSPEDSHVAAGFGGTNAWIRGRF
jgi:hypothetical protein